MSNFFIKCEEAGHVCDKNQYKEASFSEKIKLNFHLIYCSACRKYVSTNNKLSKLIKSISFQFLSSEEKQALKNAFDKELQKHQH